MTRKGFYNAVFTLSGILALGVGGFAQGKHGGGNKGGDGDHGNRGGGQEKHERRGNEDRGGERGNGNGHGWGRQKQDDGGQQRAYQMQLQRQQEQQQRENERAARQRNDWAFRGQRDQQRQYERSVREQQEQYVRQQREQQRQNERAARQQQYYPQPEPRQDNGRHLGWYKNGKAYAGNNNGWQNMDRDWRNEDNGRGGRTGNRHYAPQNSYTYNNYSDPIVNYLPAYQQQYYRPSSGSTRENIVRSLISSFFTGGRQQPYYPAYQSYQAYQSYTPYYGGAYQQPYYQNTSYSPSYGSYSPYYGSNGYGYDPYASAQYGDGDQQPSVGTQMFGGGGLKSSLLNVGLSLLQGFLGNGYEQGLNQGEYVRDQYARPVGTYYDPYAAPEQAYYSPLASSFADQRQLLQEGYRLGYRDAMQQQEPYENVLGNNAPVNLVSQFLANSLLNRI